MNIAFDVDDVLAAFTPHVFKCYGKKMPDKLDYWSVPEMNKQLEINWFLGNIAKKREFWLTLPILNSIDVPVRCYISSFPVHLYRSRMGWLIDNGFPIAPLICSSDKISVCREFNVDLLIDDKPQMMKDLVGSGIQGLHYIAPYAGFEPVGNYITDLKQIKYCI